MKKRLVVFLGMCLVLVLGLTVFSARADVFRAIDPKTERILHDRAVDPKTERILHDRVVDPKTIRVLHDRVVDPKTIRVLHDRTVDPLDEDQVAPQLVEGEDYSIGFERCICPKIVRIYGPPDHIETP